MTMSSMSREYSVTIPSGTALSPEINLSGYIPVALVFPSAWTTANITFQVRTDSGDWVNAYTAAGSEVVASAAADRYVSLDPVQMFGATHLRLRSGTSGTPVNQAADRAVIVMLGDWGSVL